MAQTADRAKEMGKRIAAERDPKKKAYLKQWDAGEKISNRTYGTKGRIIKAHRPGSHQEAVEYAEWLESILTNLCEELDIDPDALLEDVQTYDRWKERHAKHKKLTRDAYRKGSGRKEFKALDAHARESDREDRSKTLYGKGGKAIRKGTPAHAAALKKTKADWAAHHERTKQWHRKMSDHPDRGVRADYNAQMGGYRDAADRRRATRPTRREMEGPGLADYD